MSITSRIEEMTAHIGNAYNTLELAGADMYEINKNIVNLSPMWKERLLYFINNGIDEVWENWDKEEGNGISFTLNQTVKAPMKIQYWGNTYQETTAGKNIFDLNKVIYWDSCIRLETGMKFQNLWSAQIVNSTNVNALFEPNTTYTCKVKTKITSKPSTVKETQVPIALYRRSSESSSYLFTPVVSAIANNPLNTEIEKITTFTTPDDLTEVVLLGYCWYGNNDGSTTYSGTGTIEFNDFMIVKGTYTAANFPSYEPYTNGPSPNPDYPQDIQVVSGDNSIEVVGKNLFDIGTSNSDYVNTSADTSPTWLNVDNNILSITIQGSGTTVFYRKTQYKENGTFTINSVTSVNEARYYIRIRKLDDSDWMTNSDTSISGWTYNADYRGWYINVRHANNDETFTIPNCLYWQIGFGWDTSTLVGTTQTMSNIQLEKGNQATTYEAYKGASYSISLGAENLLNSNINKTTLNGITFTPIYNDDSTLKYIIANGTASANVYFTLGNVNVKANISYTLSGCPVNDGSNAYRLYAYMYDSNNTYLNVAIDYGYGNGNTFSNANLDHVQVGFTVTSGKTVNNFKIYPMLEEGNKLHSYTPYGQTPIELCKIGTYQDKIDKSTGKNLFDGVLVDGYYYTPSKTITGTPTTVFKSFTIDIKQGIYTLSCNTNINMVRAFTDYNNSTDVIFGGTTVNVKSYVMTITQDTKLYISVRRNDNTSWLATDLLQLEKGTSSSDYEPYGTGWYLKKEIGKVVLNGSENWGEYTTQTSDGYRVYTTDVHIGLTGEFQYEFLSDYFQHVGFALVNNIALTKFATYLNIDNTVVNTVANFKTWLSTHNTSIFYPLATPTYETITDTTLIGQLEALKKSYEGQTNISQVNNDLPFELDAIALREMDDEWEE